MFYKKIEHYLITVYEQKILYYGLMSLLLVYSSHLPSVILLIGWSIICVIAVARRRLKTNISWVAYPIFTISMLIVYKVAYFLGNWADKLIHH